MKFRFIHLLLSGLLLTTFSCQNKNKSAATTEVEKEVVQTIMSDSTTIDLIEDKININQDSTHQKVENTAVEEKEPEPKPISKIAEVKSSDIVENIEKEDLKSKPNETKIIDPTTSKTNPPTEKVITESEETIVNIEEKEISIEEVEKETSKTKPEKPIKVNVPVGYPNHKLFDDFLKKYVSNSGQVKYNEIAKNPTQLDAYLKTLEETKFNTTWSRQEKLAFWINSYNAYTIKLIVDNYPVNKITDLHNGKPWDFKWIKLNGQTLSLNNIENDIIRPEFKEPRIHFAVNCAAKSCPPIHNAAFTANNLETKLESQTKKFINNKIYNNLGKNEITISKIFEWYSSDFGDVVSYIARYSESIVKPSAKVKYNEYDWTLNGK